MQKQWFEMMNKMAEESYEAMKKVSDMNIQTLEKMVGQQTETFNSCLESARASFDKLAAAKTYQDVLAVQSEAFTACSDKLMKNYKTLVDAVSDSRDQYKGLFEEGVKAAEANVKKAAETLKKAA